MGYKSGAWVCDNQSGRQATLVLSSEQQLTGRRALEPRLRLNKILTGQEDEPAEPLTTVTQHILDHHLATQLGDRAVHDVPLADVRAHG